MWFLGLYLFLRMKLGGASRWRKSKMQRSPSSPQIHQKYIYLWNNSYRTPTECWQKTSDFSKGKKVPTYLSRAKEKRKNRDKRIGTGPAPVGGELWRRKGFHTLGSPFRGRDCRWWMGEASERQRRALPQGCGGQSGEMPAQRIGADQHSPAREACLLPRRGGRGWELRLGFRSDRRERTGAGGVNTAWRGLVRHG